MVWRTLLVAGALLLAGGPARAAEKDADKKEGDKADSYIKVEIKGTLKTGIVAIGGETTGILVQTKNGTLELDLGKDRDKAEKLDGKTVLVKGTLTIRRGVEVRQRMVVKVSSIQAAEGEEK